jgi:hypothetical protein
MTSLCPAGPALISASPASRPRQVAAVTAASTFPASIDSVQRQQVVGVMCESGAISKPFDVKAMLG